MGTTTQGEDKDAVTDKTASDAEQVNDESTIFGWPGQARKVRVTYDDGSTGHRWDPQRLAFSNRADGKLFWITLTATVAGTLASVLIVAVAVLWSRWLEQPGTHGGYAILVLAVIGYSSMAYFSVIRTIYAWNKALGTRLTTQYFRFIVPVGMLLLTIFVLGLLGIAVGIK